MITYLEGDATEPIGTGRKVICHVCNDRGAWGAGFVRALSAKWIAPEAAYRAWHEKGLYALKLSPCSSLEIPFTLGEIQLVSVESDITVANMIAQQGLRHFHKPCPLRYEALDECLSLLGADVRRIEASVHMPRIGCGLGGGRWEEVEPIIVKQLIGRGIPVFVYDLL